MYLIQRFSALLKLCAIVRRVLLLSGSGAVAMCFDTFSRWITSDDFISILISIPRAFGRGTNSNERFSNPLLHEIIASRSYTTKHGRRSR
uniref:hypothetical protein n=1 Tax=Hungatella hathewayi TaxID=154046 RepID=UPI003BA99DE8